MSDKEIGDPNVQYVEEVETSVVTEEVIFHSKFQSVEEAADGSNPSGASGIVVGNPVTTVVIEEASSAPGGSAGGKVVVLPDVVTIQLVQDGIHPLTSLLPLFHAKNQDLKIVCRANAIGRDEQADGEVDKMVTITTSKVVLAASSKHISRMLKSVEESVYEKDDTTTIFLPDFDQDTVGNMINLLLHGMVNCPDLVSLAKLQKLTRTMKLIFNFLLPGEPPPPAKKTKTSELTLARNPSDLGNPKAGRSPVLLKPVKEESSSVGSSLFVPPMSQMSEKDLLLYKKLAEIRKLTSLHAASTLGFKTEDETPYQSDRSFIKRKKRMKVMSDQQQKSLKQAESERDNNPMTEYQCKMCDETVKGIGTLAHHMKSHAQGLAKTARLEMPPDQSDDKSLAKVKYAKRKESPYGPLQRVLSSTGVIGKRLTCDKCNEVFSSRRVFVTHMNHHRMMKKMKGHGVACDICKEVFENSIALDLHRNQTHNITSLIESQTRVPVRVALRQDQSAAMVESKNDKNYICENCGFATNSERNLEQHKRSHDDEKRYKCEYCPKSFSLREAFISHENRHKGIFPYVCDLCAKPFTLKNNLHHHRLRVHFDYKRYECTICNFRCKTKPVLTRHLICHTDSSVKPFECALCSTRFHNMCAGRRHAKKSHSKKIDEAQIRFVSCPELDRLSSVAMRTLQPEDEAYHPVMKDPVAEASRRLTGTKRQLTGSGAPSASNMGGARRTIVTDSSGRFYTPYTLGVTQQSGNQQDTVTHREIDVGALTEVMAANEKGELVTYMVPKGAHFVDVSTVEIHDHPVGTDAVEAIEVHPGRDDGEDDFEVGEEEEEDENVDEEDFEEGVEDAEGIMEDDTEIVNTIDGTTVALEDDESGGYEIVKVEIPAEGGAGAISVEEYHPSKQQAIASIIDSTQRDSNVVSGPQTEQIQVISGDDGCDTQASEAADAGTTATHHVIAMPSSSTTKIYYQKLE